MGFWRDLWNGNGARPNTTVSTPDSVGPTYNPGDSNGVEVTDDGVPAIQNRAVFVPSPWDGWPASWASPLWEKADQKKYDGLVDTAWACLDLNASVMSAMPVYRTRDGAVLPAKTWMTNPDPAVYTGWAEFAKQLFWDFQMGEAYVLRMVNGADGWPFSFRVVPPWLVKPEMSGGGRTYKIGDMDVTNDILHIRYKSTSDGAHGVGPLECAGARLVAAGVLSKYAAEIAQGGGIPKYVLESEQELTFETAEKLKEAWWRSRMADLGMPWKPAVLSGGLKAHPLQLNPQEMALNELAMYTEARISNLLGVPGFLMGLSTGDPMTYSNAATLFDFHDRRKIKPDATHVMTALSNWALPRGQSVELNRDEYTRPPLKERVESYEKLLAMGVLSVEEIRVMERFVDAGTGPSPEDSPDDLVAAEALT